MNRILFLCTGNYYRSRFAEEYWNHHADLRGLDWRADSRALLRDFAGAGNRGPISRHAVAELERRRIPITGAWRFPRRLEAADLDGFQRVVAMSRAEHAPMVEELFPAARQRIDYFEIGDVEIESPALAIGRLVRCLDELMQGL
jgi:protein-tyrosine phosphatase